MIIKCTHPFVPRQHFYLSLCWPQLSFRNKMRLHTTLSLAHIAKRKYLFYLKTIMLSRRAKRYFILILVNGYCATLLHHNIRILNSEHPGNVKINENRNFLTKSVHEKWEHLEAIVKNLDPQLFFCFFRRRLEIEFNENNNGMGNKKIYKRKMRRRGIRSGRLEKMKG